MHTPQPKIHDLAETSTFGIFRGRNVCGRNVWAEMSYIPLFAILTIIFSVRVYVVIISKYATKIGGTQNRQVACVHGTQDQKQSTFSKLKPAQ